MSIQNTLTHYSRSIIILLLIIILGGGWFFFLGPEFETLRTEIANLKKEKDVLASKEDRLNELKNITRDYREIEEEKIRKINSVLPSEEDLPGIFVQMQALAEENGFILRFIEIKEKESGIRNHESGRNQESGIMNQENNPPTSHSPLQGGQGGILKGGDNLLTPFTKGELREIGITLKLEGGSYEKIKKFLNEVEKHLRILDVVSVNFDSGGSSFGVELKTYCL